MFPKKKVVEKIKAHFSYSMTFFGHREVYEVMWENMVETDRRHMTICIQHCMLDTLGLQTQAQNIYYLLFTIADIVLSYMFISSLVIFTFTCSKLKDLVSVFF
jgi:hypothetical protein